MDAVIDKPLASPRTPKITKIVSDLGRKLSRRDRRKSSVSRSPVTPKPSTNADEKTAPKSPEEKDKERERLATLIARRPSKVDLKLRNILRVDSSDDLAKIGVEKSLNFQLTSQNVKSILKRRPQRNSLEDKNILKSSPETDPSLAAVQDQLRRSQLADQLESKLRDRPDLSDLEKSKLLNFQETVEVVSTFKRSEYNRRPDTMATFRKLTPSLKMQIREELNTFKRSEMDVHDDSHGNTCFH